MAMDCTTNVCPDHKPFCTDIGCTSKCPDSDYINGTTCVISCGEMFVTKDNVCQELCSSEKFISESIVRIGSDLYKEKRCVDVCDKFVHDRSCVQACPAEASYVDEERCMERCPENKNIINVEEPSKELHCSQRCVFHKVFEDGLCVQQCSKYEFVFNNTCLNSCPNEANLIESRPGPNRKYCTNECSLQYFKRNGSCVSFCSNLELTYNKTCVVECPSEARYIINNKSCANSCPNDQFILGKVCVKLCPNKMMVLNQVCVTQCPMAQPTKVELRKLLPSYRYVTYFKCELKCPNAKGSDCSCLTSQPYFYNDTCVESCPPTHSLSENINGLIHCVSSCNEGKFIFNSTCMSACPPEAIYSNNNLCTDKCPPTYLQYKHFETIICVNECPDRKFTLISEIYCVEECPASTPFISEKQCVSTCPPGTPFVRNNSCFETCHEKEISRKNVCIASADCTLPYVIVKGECLDHCPFGYIWDIYFIDNHCYSVHVYAVIIACLCVGSVVFIIWNREATKNFFTVTKLVVFLLVKGRDHFDISRFDKDIRDLPARDEMFTNKNFEDDEGILLHNFNNEDALDESVQTVVNVTQLNTDISVEASNVYVEMESQL